MCAIMGFSSKSAPIETVRQQFAKTISRGPDMSRIVDTGSGYLCFHRLAIMGLTEAGMQPFPSAATMLSATASFTAFES